MAISRRTWSVLTVCLAVVLLVLATSVALADNGQSSNAVPDNPAGSNITPEAFSIQFYYFNAAGSAFAPRDSSTSWDYQSGGCVSAGVGNDIFTLHLDLPQGARIDYLRIYYRDTSAANSRAWVTTYDGAGNFSDLTAVDSTGNGGYGTTLSPYVGHVVDKLNRSYVLNWRPEQTGASMQLCGLRVAYRLQVRQFYLPVMHVRYP